MPVSQSCDNATFMSAHSGGTLNFIDLLYGNADGIYHDGVSGETQNRGHIVWRAFPPRAILRSMAQLPLQRMPPEFVLRNGRNGTRPSNPRGRQCLVNGEARG
jgi:hypothetical protein